MEETKRYFSQSLESLKKKKSINAWSWGVEGNVKKAPSCYQVNYTVLIRLKKKLQYASGTLTASPKEIWWKFHKKAGVSVDEKLLC